tara:strand:- start:225 stop:410 length:186 start_codon:yes stop_codon:yes gene_type:complete
MKLSKFFSWEFIIVALLFFYLLVFISGCSSYHSVTLKNSEYEALIALDKNDLADDLENNYE